MTSRGLLHWKIARSSVVCTFFSLSLQNIINISKIGFYLSLLNFRFHGKAIVWKVYKSDELITLKEKDTDHDTKLLQSKHKYEL